MAYASPTPQWEQVIPRGCGQCAAVQQGQDSSRQRNSIVNVAWVNRLLVYSQFTLQVRIKKYSKVYYLSHLYSRNTLNYLPK